MRNVSRCFINISVCRMTANSWHSFFFSFRFDFIKFSSNHWIKNCYHDFSMSTTVKIHICCCRSRCSWLIDKWAAIHIALALRIIIFSNCSICFFWTEVYDADRFVMISNEMNNFEKRVSSVLSSFMRKIKRFDCICSWLFSRILESSKERYCHRTWVNNFITTLSWFIKKTLM